jgi:hypothetical protein
LEVSDEDFRFAFGRFSEGDDMDFIVGLSVHYGNGDALQKSQRDQTSLTVGNTIVFKGKRRAREGALRVGEVDTVLPKIALSLGVVPCEVHSGILSQWLYVLQPG